MTVVLRIVIAIAAIMLGNAIIPNGDVIETFSDATKSYELKMFGGTALIVAGAFLLARTTVGALKSYLKPDD